MRRAGTTAVRGIFIVLFFGFLISGFVLYLTGYEPAIKLSGVYVKETFNSPEGRRETLKSIGNGSFFSEAEKIYNQDYPLRPFSIKLNNSIEFLQGKSTNTSVMMAKNYDLYEYNYIHDYLIMMDVYNGYNNTELLRSIGEKLAFIKETLEKNGKHMYVLITPNKAGFSAENMPDELTGTEDGKEKIRNIEMLKRQFDELGVPYFDGAKYIREELPAGVIPFYRSGIHYSWPAAYHMARAFYAQIEKDTGLKMPRFDLKVENQDEVVFPNQDLFNLMNTFNGLTGWIYGDKPQQGVTIENAERSPVTVMMQGGSFLGPYIEMNTRYPWLFRGMDIIQNTAFITKDNEMFGLGSTRDVDLEKVRNDQLFIFEVNEAVAPDMGWGFIDHFAESVELMTEEDPVSGELDFSKPESIRTAYSYGIYDLEGSELPWRFTAREFGCQIENEKVFSDGLAFGVSIPGELQAAEGEPFKVRVKVNGVEIGEYEPDGNGMITVSPEELSAAQTDGKTCLIDCSVNKAFIPHELNPESTDTRELALILYSITPGTKGEAE